MGLTRLESFLESQTAECLLILKMGQPRPLLFSILVFSNKHHYNFYNKNICEKSIGTSLQVLPSFWSADFLQNWRQEIPQIIAQNSWKLCFHPYKMSWTKFGWKTLLDLWTLIILWHLETIWGFEFVIFVSKITKILKHV